MRLFSLTLPGLDVPSDWRAVHDRLLDDFPAIDDVLPTTTPATILIVHEGSAFVDGWLDSIDEAILSRRLVSTARTATREKTYLGPQNYAASATPSILVAWPGHAPRHHRPLSTNSRPRSWKRSGGKGTQRSSA